MLLGLVAAVTVIVAHHVTHTQHIQFFSEPRTRQVAGTILNAGHTGKN